MSRLLVVRAAARAEIADAAAWYDAGTNGSGVYHSRSPLCDVTGICE